MNNLKLTLLAGAFLLGLTASTSVVLAQAPATIPTTPPTTPGCQINCDGGDTTSPGDPFDPFPDPGPGDDGEGDGDGGPGEPGGDPDGGPDGDPACMDNCDPGKPGDKPKGGTTQALVGDCGDKLGMLRRVTESQVASVGNEDLVDVVPVCRSKSLAAEQEDVAQLRPAIGQNEVLDSELGRKGFNPEDVVGVIVNDSQVVLYVHPR